MSEAHITENPPSEGVDVKFNLDAIREVLARLVDHDVPAGHQEQALVALEEQSARVGEWPPAIESADAGGSQE